VDPPSLHAACVDRHADERPDADALRVVQVDGRLAATWSWADVRDASARMATLLRHDAGVARGDRVGIVLPQRAETALLHVACSRVGAVATPLSPLFGPDGLRTRLGDARPALVVTTREHRATVQEATDAPVRVVEDLAWGDHAPMPAAEQARPSGDDAAFLLYTSGTTGHPKGALLPHRVVGGRMPGFLLAHEPFDVEAGRLFWSPADWSWIGGLHDSLFAPWHAGAAVLAQERVGHFDPAGSLVLMASQQVTDAFLPPTALKALARSGVDVQPSALRAVHSAGEPLAEPVARWARARLCPHVTEVFGLTECAFLVGTSVESYESPPGSMGRPYPTHLVEVVEEETAGVSPGPSPTSRSGEIRVRRGDPTMMLGYWRGPDAAPELPLDEDGRLRTGDLARVDDEGFLYYLGRKDDLIKTSGYRVGPAEVEAELLRHPAVAECAVVGVPDEERGQRVKAFVKLAPRVSASPALAEQLKAFVRARLAAHAYPRDVEFVESIPMTVSGKVQRARLR